MLALAVEPRVLLLDGPFGGLDEKVRNEPRCLNKGCIEQIGCPEDIHEKPTSPFVHNFIGVVNELSRRVSGGNILAVEGAIPLTEGSLFDCCDVVAFARPHHIDILRVLTATIGIPAFVSRTFAVGAVRRVEFRVTEEPRPGDILVLQLESRRRRTAQTSVDTGRADKSGGSR